MTRTPIEIATALKRLERYSPEIHPMVAEAAAMLREVAAERDRLTAMVEKMREYAGHRLDCEAGGNYPFLSEHCTCGVSEVLKESENG